MKRINIIGVVILIASVAAATAAAHTTGGSLSLIALLDAEAGDGEDHLRLPADAEREGRLLHPVLRRLDDQAKAVAAGQADLVFLSTGDDVNLLVDAGLVNQNWDQQAYNGIVADTVVVFAVRDGNPKHIKGWDDLIKPGVQIVTPNPFSSGSAKWNILAAYGAARRLGKTDAQARHSCRSCSRTSSRRTRRARTRRTRSSSGKGDVLITYESEAIAAKQAGQNIGYLVPGQTMLIELPIAPIKKSSNLALVNKFIPFAKSAPAQTLFAQYGYRPVNKSVAKQYRSSFPTRALTTIDNTSIGGWRKVDKRWFDPQHGLMVEIEKCGWRANLASTTPRSHDLYVSEREGADRPLARLRHDLPLGDRRAADRRARLGRRARAGCGLLERRLDPEAVARSS